MNSNAVAPQLQAAQSPTPDGADGLADIRPPVEIPTLWPLLWWGLAVLALILLIVVLGLWWKRRRAVAPPVAVIPAHVRARQKLQDALSLIDRPKPFCIAVSDTLRRYLEERFELRAPERTTEEFLHELQDAAILTPVQKASLADFLTRCDLVKFAKYHPERPELQALFDSASRLIDETEPAPATAQPAPA